ncbi:MAG: sensor histidine kinase [Sedimentisphaerales bacterium]|nr:sensor histidine kinase [Sedimentisphaerales bacterium]
MANFEFAELTIRRHKRPFLFDGRGIFLYRLGLVLVLSATAAPRLGHAGSSPPPSTVLTSVGEIRQLSLAAAAFNTSVRLQGVITYYDVNHEMAFLQDETGGIYFKITNSDPAAPSVSFGDRVELCGFTQAGNFSPSIVGLEGHPLGLRRLGRGALPTPIRPPLNHLLDPSLHDQWVEINAVVTRERRSATRVRLDLNTGGQQFQAVLPASADSPSIPASWLHQELRLRGVYSALFSQRGQLLGFELFVQSTEQIEQVRNDAMRLFAEETVPVSELMRFKDGTQERVRVKGVVLLHIPGVSLYLRGDDGELMVQTTTRERLQRGQAVEAVGSPAPGKFCPSLREAIVRAGELGPAPEPVELVPEQALTADQEAQLVRIKAQLTDVFRGNGDNLILLHSGMLTFEARLLFQLESGGQPQFVPGSWLELTGVCSLNAESDWRPINPAKPNLLQRLPTSFTLLVASPTDVKVLRLPRWWTIECMAWLAGGLGILALLASVWVALLRYEVGKKSHLLATIMQREGIREERARIARDLHDTLQQNLTGIMLQTNSAMKRLAVAPDRAAEALELVQSMARHSFEEVRHTISNLRATELDYAELGPAVDELLTSFGQPNPPRIRVVLPETTCRLPGILMNHLLNFIREAVTNALRHASASNIDIRITRGHELLEVTIADDGKGFETNGTDHLNTGHFGLRGMRERALKMKARYQLTSIPGRGTTVRLTLPLSEHADLGKPA